MLKTVASEVAVRVNGETFRLTLEDVRRQRVAVGEQCEGCGLAFDADQNGRFEHSPTGITLRCDCGASYPAVCR